MLNVEIDKKEIIIAEQETRKVVIRPAETLLDEDGNSLFDINGVVLTNDTNRNVITEVKKPFTPTDVTALEDAQKAAYAVIIQAKVDAYTAAIAAQLLSGGPGPVADYEIMHIVNDHGGNFQVVFR